MADFTKKAIKAAFTQLLNEKPLKQISVKDIVDRCGVNRNTFYYHFQDIPALLETIVREDAEHFLELYPKITTIEECLNAAASFVLEHRQAVLHIYRSANRSVYEQYQWRVCGHAVDVYIDGVLEGRKICEADRGVVEGYLRCVLFGLIIGWLRNGLRDDIGSYIHRLSFLKEGELERVLSRCRTEEEI